MPKPQIHIPYSRVENGSFDKATTERHASFGMVSASRVQGKTHLFGSHVDNHLAYIRLSICQAEVSHSTERDWYRDRDELISVDLSASQFAELITNMNVGGGVPCTLRRVMMEQVEPVPQETATEATKIKTNFRARISSLVEFLDSSKRKAEAILSAPKTLTKKDKEELLHVFEKTLMEVKSNAPFVVEAFVEATEKVETSAKTEIEAFVNLIVTSLGVKKLSELNQENVRQLPRDGSV